VELSTFLVNRVIIHQIPKVAKQDKSTTKPVISDLETPLNDSLKRYFRERITTSFGAKQFASVYRKPTDEEVADGRVSPVPQLVLDFFNGDGSNFIQASQSMARHLFSIQTGTNSEGMLVLIDGTIGSGGSAGRCLCILKLEMSGALAVTEQQDTSGKTHFDAEVRDITLQKKAQVFKAALFGRSNSLASLSPIVSDDQRDPKQHGTEIATFFLRFIGCGLRDTPERSTKQYLETVERFVNEKVADPQLKKTITMQLMVDLSSNSGDIDPKEAAKRYLPTAELQDQFLEPFKNEDSSIPVFQKDDSLVRARMKKVVAEFTGNIKLSGPMDSINSALQPEEDGSWKLDAELRHIGPGG
jgi:nucleoid-associated protein YejK